MGKRYKIPYGTEVEIVNKNSRYFRKTGTLVNYTPEDNEYMVVFEDKNGDSFCEFFRREEVLPVQNILKITDLQKKTLAEVFDPNYLYETNKVVVYLGDFTYEEVENAYRGITEDFTEYYMTGQVLILLESMLGYDEDEFDIPIAEMITFVQWWAEGLRTHVTSGNKNRRYFSTEDFELEFVKLDGSEK